MSNHLQTLVIDRHALQVLVCATIEEAWFEHFGLPAEARSLRRVQKANTLYILSSKADENSKLLVIRVGAEGIFGSVKIPSRRHLFDRVLHVALADFENATFIPVKWRSYTGGALLSVYAQPETIGASYRV